MPDKLAAIRLKMKDLYKLNNEENVLLIIYWHIKEDSEWQAIRKIQWKAVFIQKCDDKISKTAQYKQLQRNQDYLKAAFKICSMQWRQKSFVLKIIMKFCYFYCHQISIWLNGHLRSIWSLLQSNTEALNQLLIINNKIFKGWVLNVIQDNILLINSVLLL